MTQHSSFSTKSSLHLHAGRFPDLWVSHPELVACFFDGLAEICSHAPSQIAVQWLMRARVLPNYSGGTVADSNGLPFFPKMGTKRAL
jgi:hypothetical protein